MDKTEYVENGKQVKFQTTDSIKEYSLYRDKFGYQALENLRKKGVLSFSVKAFEEEFRKIQEQEKIVVKTPYYHGTGFGMRGHCFVSFHDRMSRFLRRIGMKETKVNGNLLFHFDALKWANLRELDLKGADLGGANIDEALI